MGLDNEAGRAIFLCGQGEPSCGDKIKARHDADHRQKALGFNAFLHGPRGVLPVSGADENDAGRVQSQTGDARTIGMAEFSCGFGRRAPEQRTRLSGIFRAFGPKGLGRETAGERQSESHGRRRVAVIFRLYFMQANVETSPWQAVINIAKAEAPSGALAQRGARRYPRCFRNGIFYVKDLFTQFAEFYFAVSIFSFIIRGFERFVYPVFAIIVFVYHF
jgi:hypothetical protein